MRLSRELPAAGARLPASRIPGWSAALIAPRLVLPPGARRKGLEKLFARTAAAFGAAVPPARARSAAGRLREYASFTRRQAEEALRSGRDLAALERRLYRGAYALGAGYRLRLRLRSSCQVLAAARLLYRGLGIDFRGSPGGGVTIRRCGFASIYTPEVCGLVSALDRGLIAGLSGGAQLRFLERITEGAAACRACIEAAGTAGNGG